MKKICSISLICLIIDQFIKLLITINFKLYEGIVVIPNFFSIIRVHNTGAAWSFLTGNTFALILLSLLALVAIYLFFIKNTELKKLEKIIYGVLIGGILGNLIDRIFRGYVVDFLDFQIFKYNFPVFNLADICIVVSVIIILILQFGGKKNECDQSNRK